MRHVSFLGVFVRYGKCRDATYDETGERVNAVQERKQFQHP